MLYKRSIFDDIKEYLGYFPVVLISGARQVGKSTLALNLGIDNFYTLDDINLFESVKKDPKGFIINSPKPMIIDEIQRFPKLLIAIKEYIDKDRKNGEFILTGSANLKGFKEISDSLAGRVAIIELFGLSLKEKYLNHSSNLIYI